MTARRFTEKPELDPSAVWSLPTGHLALTENRTLFPSTVVDVDENFEGDVLVSGQNNRKLGKTVTKGKFKGYELYGLSLEERATCPTHCSARGYCYGNTMQLARRHRIVDLDLFELALQDQITDILETSEGVLVRLHVLGDFQSVDYIRVWAKLLIKFDGLACYGYTHHSPDDAFGISIQNLKDMFPDRFRIRWSGETKRQDGAIVINEIPSGPRFNGALVCPAQTDATACCASCGLCWEGASKKETIAFIKHGKKTMEAAAQSESLPTDHPRGPRPVLAIALPSGITPKPIVEPSPQIMSVDPRSLLIEGAYQRDLSGRSIKLIRKIVANWDWVKFKPPVCAKTPDGLFVIDGQHTAIAAATHPEILEIPVIIAEARNVEQRAAAFVSHNRERLTMTPAQIFYGDLAAGDLVAKRIMQVCAKTGATVPRLQVARSYAQPGQIAAIGELRSAGKQLPPTTFERLLRIAVLSKAAPITKAVLRSLREIMTDDGYKAVRALSDEKLASIIASYGDFDRAARICAAETGQSHYRAGAEMIAAQVDA